MGPPAPRGHVGVQRDPPNLVQPLGERLVDQIGAGHDRDDQRRQREERTELLAQQGGHSIALRWAISRTGQPRTELSISRATNTREPGP